MKKKSLDFFLCPSTGSKLKLQESHADAEGEITSGFLLNEKGERYEIVNGIPDFTIFSQKEKNDYAIKLFKNVAEEYDKYHHLSFEIFSENETAVRNSMIDKLRLKPDSTVLEVNAGTGRDSVLIAKRLSTNGLLHLQDISREMLSVCKEKVHHSEAKIEIHQGNGSRLPYSSRQFDAVYSFGGVGMNAYSDNRSALAEIVRVTKIGGRVVLGGIGLAPWLRETVFAKILLNQNDHYANQINFTDIPVQARNLCIQWILSGAGFVIDFTVGEGEPEANYDLEIPGKRGGTLRTRYCGKLEGVSKETFDLAQKARDKLGISMHQWLDQLIKKESLRILREENVR